MKRLLIIQTNVCVTFYNYTDPNKLHHSKIFLNISRLKQKSNSSFPFLPSTEAKRKRDFKNGLQRNTKKSLKTIEKCGNFRQIAAIKQSLNRRTRTQQKNNNIMTHFDPGLKTDANKRKTVYDAINVKSRGRKS